MTLREFSPVWHAQSTLLLDEPRCFAKRNLIEMLLPAVGPLTMRYAGDRMWPALTHGQSVEVEAVDPSKLMPGDVVVVCPEGIPDLLRIESLGGDRVRLAADADPDLELDLPLNTVIARAQLTRADSTVARRTWRRIRLDLGEAGCGRPDPAEDPAQTVRAKYDVQAPFYAGVEGPDIESRLLQRILQRFGRGTTVLVVGSGAGKECLDLAGREYRVRGIDFSGPMIDQARRQAERRGLQVRFDAGDVRDYRLERGSLGGILFTYDVYSFLPGEADRISLLRSMARWLAPEGTILLGARQLGSRYVRGVLCWQWLARRLRGERTEWGDSHTRYVAMDGSLHRSFVHVFSNAQLQYEIAAAGLRAEPMELGHCALTLL